MATDYDAPRAAVLEEDSLEELQARRTNTASSGKVDVDETEYAESFELPGADQIEDELSVTVVPMQSDEFRCERCFLVRHRNQRSGNSNVCIDCA